MVQPSLPSRPCYRFWEPALDYPRHRPRLVGDRPLPRIQPLSDKTDAAGRRHLALRADDEPSPNQPPNHPPECPPGTLAGARSQKDIIHLWTRLRLAPIEASALKAPHRHLPNGGGVFRAKRQPCCMVPGAPRFDDKNHSPRRGGA